MEPLRREISKISNVYIDSPWSRIMEGLQKRSILKDKELWSSTKNFNFEDFKKVQKVIDALSCNYIVYTKSEDKVHSCCGIWDNDIVFNLDFNYFDAGDVPDIVGDMCFDPYAYEEEDLRKSSNFRITVSGQSEERIENFFSYFLRDFTRAESTPTVGEINMLVSSMGGIEMKYLGKVNMPFFKDNYTSEVSNKFGEIVKELSSPTPFGRLTLLRGPAGTGKSFYIRSILSQLDSTNVYIPASMIGEISGPSLIGTIISEHRRKKNKPIIFIMEDADTSITDRNAGGDTRFLSDVLNFTDGLLGELADIRVIATTNAKITNIDPAVTRAGRLFTIVEFPYLSKDHCISLYNRRGGVGDPEVLFTNKEYSLAEFYRILRDYKAVEKVKTEGSGNYI